MLTWNTRPKIKTGKQNIFSADGKADFVFYSNFYLNFFMLLNPKATTPPPPPPPTHNLSNG